MSESVLLAFKVYGLAIVISMLVAVMIRVIVATLTAIKRQPATAAAAPTEAPVDIAGDHIAAIAAAVYAVLGAHRIVHIEDRGRGFAWTAEGRALHHASHSISKRSKP